MTAAPALDALLRLAELQRAIASALPPGDAELALELMRIGLEAQGRDTAWRRHQRDALLRRIGWRHFAEILGPSARAAALHDAWQHYAGTAWHRERDLVDCPRPAGSLSADLWHLCRLWPAPLTARRLSDVV